MNEYVAAQAYLDAVERIAAAEEAKRIAKSALVAWARKTGNTHLLHGDRVLRVSRFRKHAWQVQVFDAADSRNTPSHLKHARPIG